MSWLTRVRQGITAIAAYAKRDTPENLWHKCPSCGQLLYVKEYAENLSVCPKCGHHGRIGPDERFAQLFDNGRHERLETPKVTEDPLKFRDSKRYSDRIKTARTSTGEQDALINAYGRISGQRAVVGVQNFAFMGGSMGLGVGAAFIAGVEEALKQRAPYIIVTASGGARMQEGILSLMQMPKTTVGIAKLREAGLPYIVVLSDPTTGGVTASYAMLGDIQLAEPGALIGFAGQRVIESTIREKLPEGFQRAEYLLDHGIIDMVVPRRELPERLGQLIGYLCEEPVR
jgi:acetyl-CoA carboxylase carboxyl transferase subunit beta